MLAVELILASLAASAAPEGLPADGFTPAVVFVKLAPGVDVASLARERGFSESLRLVGGGQPVPAASANAAQVGLARRLGMDRWVRIEIPPSADPVTVAAMLEASWDGVEVAEADPLGSLSDVNPDDPLFSLQYALQNTGQLGGVVGADIKAPHAWGAASSEPVVIGFLDGGVFPHPELAGRILPGWNVPQANDITTDICSSHGTHVMGIAIGKGNNGDGIAGVAWNAVGMPVVIVNPCTGSESWLADGITWAVDHGADILNMSVQYSVGSQYLRDAVLYAAGLGVPMVASTGNSGGAVAYPAKWPETIAVGASTQADVRWASSNYGSEVDLVAPGNQIYSLSGTASYAYKNGTSMAAPHAAGTLALLRSILPNADSALLRSLLESTAHDIGIAGFDLETGWGRLDAGAAVDAAIAMLPPGDLDGDGVVGAGDLAILLGEFGACTGCDCAADLDGDCSVGGGDLSLILGYWSPQ